MPSSIQRNAITSKVNKTAKFGLTDSHVLRSMLSRAGRGVMIWLLMDLRDRRRDSEASQYKVSIRRFCECENDSFDRVTVMQASRFSSSDQETYSAIRWIPAPSAPLDTRPFGSAQGSLSQNREKDGRPAVRRKSNSGVRLETKQFAGMSRGQDRSCSRFLSQFFYFQLFGAVGVRLIKQGRLR